jgi:hypothetical protein
MDKSDRESRSLSAQTILQLSASGAATANNYRCQIRP